MKRAYRRTDTHTLVQRMKNTFNLEVKKKKKKTLNSLLLLLLPPSYKIHWLDIAAQSSDVSLWKYSNKNVNWNDFTLNVGIHEEREFPARRHRRNRVLVLCGCSRLLYRNCRNTRATQTERQLLWLGVSKQKQINTKQNAHRARFHRWCHAHAQWSSRAPAAVTRWPCGKTPAWKVLGESLEPVGLQAEPENRAGRQQWQTIDPFRSFTRNQTVHSKTVYLFISNSFLCFTPPRPSVTPQSCSCSCISNNPTCIVWCWQ